MLEYWYIYISNVAKHRDESHVCGRHVFVVKYNVVWCGSLADSLLQLPFVLPLLWLNSVSKGFSVSLITLLRWPISANTTNNSWNTTQYFWNTSQFCETQHKIIETQHKIIETQHKIVETQHKITETQHKVVETQHKITETQHKIIETTQNIGGPLG